MNDKWTERNGTYGLHNVEICQGRNMACSRNWQKVSVIGHKSIYSSSLETEIKTSNIWKCILALQRYTLRFFKRKLQSIKEASKHEFLMLKKKKSCPVSPCKTTKLTLIDSFLLSLYRFQPHNKNHNFLVLLRFLTRRQL